MVITTDVDISTDMDIDTNMNPTPGMDMKKISLKMQTKFFVIVLCNSLQREQSGQGSWDRTARTG
jgi:hypothetical protein